MAGCEEEEETRKKRQHGHNTEYRWQAAGSTNTKRYTVSKKREREDTREPQIQAGVDCRGVVFMYVSKEFYFSTTHNTCTCSFSISTPLCCQWTVPNDRSNISWEHCPNFIVSSGFKFHF